MLENIFSCLSTSRWSRCSYKGLRWPHQVGFWYHTLPLCLLARKALYSIKRLEHPTIAGQEFMEVYQTKFRSADGTIYIYPPNKKTLCNCTVSKLLLVNFQLYLTEKGRTMCKSCELDNQRTWARSHSLLLVLLGVQLNLQKKHHPYHFSEVCTVGG